MTEQVCPYCQGTGEMNDTDASWEQSRAFPTTCAQCYGTGVIQIPDEPNQDTTEAELSSMPTL
jgi:DnaJ-class molecular chaperone